MIDIAGITEVQWGVVNSVFLPVSIILGIPAGKLVDKVQRRHSILLGYTLSAVVGLNLAYTGGFGWVLVAFIFRAVGQIIVFPSVHALLADLVPVDKWGRIIGLISFLQNLIVVPAALVFVLIYEASSRALFLSSVVIEVASILIFIILFRQNDAH